MEKPVRRIRYSVAMSLDGYIAGPEGDVDWIIMDPDIDFGAIYAQFDTILVGRRTFEPMARAGRATMWWPKWGAAWMTCPKVRRMMGKLPKFWRPDANRKF